MRRVKQKYDLEQMRAAEDHNWLHIRAVWSELRYALTESADAAIYIKGQ